MRVLLIATLLITNIAAAKDCVQFNGEVEGLAVAQAIASGECVELESAVVRGPVEPSAAGAIEGHSVTFTGKVDLPLYVESFSCTNCTFEKGVNTYLATIPSLNLGGSVIHGDANFHSLTSKVDLIGTVFHGDVIFVAANIEEINLAGAKFGRAADFSGARVGGFNAPRLRAEKPILITWEQFGPRMLARNVKWALAPTTEAERRGRLAQIENTLRFWQRNAATLNQNRDVTAINYEILQLQRNYFMRPYGVEWWATFVAGVPTRYGTRPYRPLWIGLFCVSLFGLIYSKRDAFVALPNARTLPIKPPLLFALAFSLDTFLPFVEVTGARKWGWVLNERFRWYEMAERMIGLVVATLAAYGIAAAFL